MTQNIKNNLSILSVATCCGTPPDLQSGVAFVSYIEADITVPDNKFHGANMGPIWGWQDPGGPHVGPMDFAIWGAQNRKWFTVVTYVVYHIQSQTLLIE